MPNLPQRRAGEQLLRLPQQPLEQCRRNGWCYDRHRKRSYCEWVGCWLGCWLGAYRVDAQLPKAVKTCPQCGESESVFFQSQQRTEDTKMVRVRGQSTRDRVLTPHSLSSTCALTAETCTTSRWLFVFCPAAVVCACLLLEIIPLFQVIVVESFLLLFFYIFLYFFMFFYIFIISIRALVPARESLTTVCPAAPARPLLCE